MKVLYIGHYRDGTGWANAAINNILAMDKAGIEIVPRAITYEQKDSEYPDRIKELEANSSYGSDICIQHTLPHLYSYDSSYKKNIGFLATETTSFKDTGWQKYCNLMDEIWVPSIATKASCRLSGVNKPIEIVPHSLDISSYINHEQKNKIQELENSFNFVFIGEFIERKNIKALVQAFHSEFETIEPVNLFIKTSRQDLKAVQEYCNNIKRGLKIRKSYKNEIIISGKLDKHDYISVLKQCHSFVMPSRGEGFCIPALEAMSVGIPVIHTSNTGLGDYAYGTPVASRPVPCFGAVDTIPYLDNANSSWYEIDVEQLKFAMRSAYMKWNTETAKTESNKAIEWAKEYDHEAIGGLIKEILNDS